MNFESFAESRLVVSLGWTLFHSVWELGLVTIALLLVLRALHVHSAHVRYVVSVAALAIALLLPVVTFVQVSSQQQDALRGNRIGRHDGSDQALRSTRPGEAIPIAPVADGVPARNSAQFALFSSVSDFVAPYLRNFSPIAVLIWLLGIAIFSLRLGGGFGQLYRYKNEGSGMVDDRWTRAFSELCDRTGVQRKVELLRSTVVQTPIAIGTFKPIVLVPASLFLQMSPRELETIIAHELVHIRRYDPLVNLVQCAVEAIFFYHPGVWCISAQIRREREFAADAAVTEVFEDSHVTYARALANLEEIRLSTDKHMPRYATAANGGNFMQRIQRILKIKTEASTANSAWTAGLAISLTSVFLLAVLCFTS